MTVRELYQALTDRIPSALSCPWDNDGLMCCPDETREVRRVLVTLDVTADAVAHALKGGYDLVVSHHPLIFKGLKSVNGASPVSAKVISLLCGGVSVMSFHTRLDAVEGGVNDRLAALLGLTQVEPFGDEGIGRVGVLPTPLSPRALAEEVKAALGAPYVNFADGGRPVCRVAVLGGGGSDDVEAARLAGADAYVSGELKYHQLCDAPEEGMTLIEAGHFYTENPVCGDLRQMLLTVDPTLTCDLYSSNKIEVL